MLAVVFEGEGQYKLKEVDEPQLSSERDVKIKVALTGLCGTDQHILELPQKHPAKNGIILGHEFCGHVTKVGSLVSQLKVGDRVIAGPNIPCLECTNCQQSKFKFCKNNSTLGITRDGGLAQFVVAPSHAFYRIPDTLSFEEAVFAEPLSCVMNGFEKLGDCHSKNVLIYGFGPIGNYFLKLFKHFGADQVMICEPNKERRENAFKLGADKVFSPDQLEQDSLSMDIAVDTQGGQLDRALKQIMPGGQVLIFGLDAQCECCVSPFDIARWEKTIFGCFVDNSKILPSLQIIKKLDFKKLVSHKFTLNNFSDALSCVARGDGIKTLVYPGNESL